VIGFFCLIAAKEDGSIYVLTMKNPLGKITSVLILFATSALHGGVPGVSVTVKQPPNAKPIKQIVTDAKGNFAVDGLAPGKYAFAFHAPKSGDLKTEKFYIAIVGGNRPVKQAAISNRNLKDGVDVNVEVGPASKIRGQVMRMVWIPPELGSHLAGRWVTEEEAGPKASSHNSGQMSKDTLRDIQGRSVGAPNFPTGR
jgi:hypothetical protein